MRSRTVAVALLLPLMSALGCAQQEEAAQGEEQASETMEAASMESEMAAPATLTLDALNNSGVTGTAQLSHTQETLNVSLSMTGLEAGAEYAAHVHRGSCDQQGPVVAPLGTVIAGADGTGTLDATVPMEKLSAMSGEMMKEGEAGMHEGEAEMHEGEAGMQEGEAGMQEGEEAHEMSYYVQVHLPDGTPAACANVKGQRESMM